MSRRWSRRVRQLFRRQGCRLLGRTAPPPDEKHLPRSGDDLRGRTPNVWRRSRRASSQGGQRVAPDVSQAVCPAKHASRPSCGARMRTVVRCTHAGRVIGRRRSSPQVERCRIRFPRGDEICRCHGSAGTSTSRTHRTAEEHTRAEASSPSARSATTGRLWTCRSAKRAGGEPRPSRPEPKTSPERARVVIRLQVTGNGPDEAPRTSSRALAAACSVEDLRSAALWPQHCRVSCA